MSLYNMVMGENPIAAILLRILGISRDDVPRYRDCWLSEDGSTITIYTRTGGGNRDYYENEATCRANYPDMFADPEDALPIPSGPWNDDLRELHGYLTDCDDDFDSTYAYFNYDLPEECKEFVTELQHLNDSNRGVDGFMEVMTKLEKNDTRDPRVLRALEMGKRIAEVIGKDDGNAIIEV